jgi:hypothetical protein
MERELGKDLEQGKKRVAFLMDNCDAVEEKGYMKPLPFKFRFSKVCRRKLSKWNFTLR